MYYVFTDNFFQRKHIFSVNCILTSDTSKHNGKTIRVFNSYTYIE